MSNALSRAWIGPNRVALKRRQAFHFILFDFSFCFAIFCQPYWPLDSFLCVFSIVRMLTFVLLIFYNIWQLRRLRIGISHIFLYLSVCLLESNQIRGAHDKRFGAIWLSTADWLIKCGFIKLPFFFFLHLIAYLIAGPNWQRIVILYHKRHIKCLQIAAILRFYCFLLYYYYFIIFVVLFVAIRLEMKMGN